MKASETIKIDQITKKLITKVLIRETSMSTANNLLRNAAQFADHMETA